MRILTTLPTPRAYAYLLIPLAAAILLLLPASPAQAQAQQSNNAQLSTLTGTTSTDGSAFTGTLTLDPAFASATEDYIATVANSVTHIKVTPTSAHASATIQAGKGATLATATSGTATAAIPLTVGANEINVTVTAQDGTTTKTYTIVVTRATATSLVSNVGQTKGSGGQGPVNTVVTAFTTGSNAAGYTLTGIDFHIHTATASLTDADMATLTAAVWTSDGTALTNSLDNLGTKLVDLTVPSTAANVTAGPVTFAAPSNTTLAASTTYYVVVGPGATAWSGSTNLQFSVTASDNEDAGGAAGFSIANDGYKFEGGLINTWFEIGAEQSLAFRVNGAAKTGPTPGVTISSTAVGVIDGSTEVYTVKLNTAPSANVTITPTSGATGVATVSPATLTFTSTNYNMAQEVTITGVTAGTSTITHAAASTDTNYGSSLTIDSVTATVLAPSTLVSNTGQTPASTARLALQGDSRYSNAFTTGSNSDGYTVTTIDVRFRVSRASGTLNATELAALTAALYNASGADPGSTKIADLTAPTSVSIASNLSTVTFTAPAGTHLSANTTYHLVIDGTGTQIASLSVQRTTSNDQDSGGASGWTIEDTTRRRGQSSWSNRSPDSALMFAVKGGARQKMYSAGTPGVTLSKSSVSTEIGETTDYTIVLDAQPTASVTITPTSGDTTKATVTGQAKTFTTTNWDEAQTVTVTGVAAGDTAITITHAATSTDTRYNGLAGIGSVAVTVNASTKTVKFDPTMVSVGEGGTASLTVKLGRNAPSGGVALAFTYDYSGSAATTADTDTTPATLTITAGNDTGTLSIPTTSDLLVEGDETFTVTVTTSTSGWAVPSATNQATVTITDDDDDTARIAFGRVYTTTAKQTFSVAENVTGGVLTVPIIVSHLPGAETTFNISVETGGTATEGTDYSISTKSVTFPNTGTNRTQNLTIAITNDALLEENQTIELKISDSTSGTIGALYTRHAMGRLAQVTITDDERTGAKIAFGTNVGSTTLHRATVSEDVSGGTRTLPIIINRIPETSVTFAVSLPTVSSNAATENTDFSITTKSVTFGPSDTLTNGTVSKNISVTITDDSLVEEDQAIRLWIDDSATNNLGRHYARHNNSREARLTIEDDEQREAKIVIGTTNLTVTAEQPLSATETDANFTMNVPVTISAKPESSVTIPVTVVTQGTTATSADYTLSAASVTFGPGAGVSTTQNLVVTVRGDELVEEDQTIILRVGDTSSGLGRFYARADATRKTTFTINDDERPAAKVAFHASNAASTAKYTANVNENGGTINVPITISDLPESQTTFTVEVLTSTATEHTGTASVHEDFRVLGNKTVIFTNTGSKSKNIQVRLNNNALVEHQETINLRIVAADSTSSGLNKHYARHASGALATLTVADDDAANAKIAIGTNAQSTMKFTHSLAENVTNGTYAIPIKVSHSPSVDTIFELEIVTGGNGGTATDGTDYSIGTKTFTLTPTTTSATVTVTLTNDAWVEDDQTIEVRVKAANTSGATLEKYYARDANGALGQITIEDDEQRAARIAFGTATRTTQYTANGEETVGTLKVPIAINHLPESDTTFTVEVLSSSTAREMADSTNTAGNPKDFVIGTKTVTFGAATDKSMNLTITIENDVVEEDDETLDIRIVAKDSTSTGLNKHYDRGGSESTVGAGATARITIKSEDAVSKVTLTTSPTGEPGVLGGDILMYEGQELTVTATSDIPVGPGGWAVTLTLRPWQSILAASPNDIRFPAAADFTIAEGQTQATAKVTILTDTRTEQQELLHIGGTAARKGRELQVRPRWTRARINDSGAGITLSTTTLGLLPTEQLTYTVRLNQAPTADVTVTPASSATGRATVGSALTFTSTNWETPQPVTVTGVAAGSATITHTVSSTDSAYTGLTSLPSLTATVTAATTTFALVVKEGGASTATAEEGETVELELTADTIAGMGGLTFDAEWSVEPAPIAGTAGVTVSHTGLTVTASGTGNTSTYTVRLNSQPTSNVTITPTSSSTTNATVSPTARTFNTNNWATPQEFTVTGVATGAADITHAATSSDTSYEGATVGTVGVTVAAAAVAPNTLTLSTNAPMNRVNEGGSLLVIATLNQAAASGTTVTLTVDAASTATVTADYTLPTTITIPAGKTSWYTTLRAVDDTVYDGVNAETVVLEATGGGLTALGVIAHIIDNERGVTVTVPEGKRRADASITLPDDDVPSVGVKRIRVTASRSMWSARSGKGSVTITYTDDDGGEATVAFGSNAAATSAYQATVMEDVSSGTLTVPVTVSGAANEALEFRVVVLSDSTAREATSAAQCTDGSRDFYVGAITNTNANRKTVTIGAGETTANLTITICDDALGEPDETIRLAFAPARTPARTVPDLFMRRPGGKTQAVITIDSEDVPTSVRLSNPNHPLAQSGANVQEGQTVTVQARLDIPADQGGVTVTLVLDTTSATPHSTSTNPAQPSDYTFPAPFTIPAGETTATAVVRLPTDQTVDGDKTLRFTATTNPSLTVTFPSNLFNFEIGITDVDRPGLGLSRSSVTVAEGAGSQQGTAATYTVRLTTRPTANVTVALASEDESKATVSPATLTFTSTNWQNPQTVTVQAEAQGLTRITHTATSTDNVYNNATKTLSVRVNPPTTTPVEDPPPGPPGGGSPPGPPGGGGPPGPPGGGGGPPVVPPVASPVFGEGGQTTRPLPADAQSGEAIGGPITATHAGGLNLTYSLSGADAALFTVDPQTGQLRLKQDADLTEGETYSVIVAAAVPSGASASITVVIEVSEPLNPYDRDRDGSISFEEAVEAVQDYKEGSLTLEEVLDVVRRYFKG